MAPFRRASRLRKIAAPAACLCSLVAVAGLLTATLLPTSPSSGTPPRNQPLRTGPENSSLRTPQAAGAARLSANYGKLPLAFELNRGQTDARVKFLSRGRGYSLFLTGDEAVLSLRSQARFQGSDGAHRAPEIGEPGVGSQKRKWQVASGKWQGTPNSEPPTPYLLHSPFTIQNSSFPETRIPIPDSRAAGPQSLFASPESRTPTALRMTWTPKILPKCRHTSRG